MMEQMEKKQQEKPNGGIILDGEKITFQEMLKSLERLISWANPEFNTNRLQFVVLCENCKHYKSIKHICLKEDKRREPTFFCKEGEYKYVGSNKEHS